MTNKHSAGKAFYAVIGRAFLCIPLGAVALGLTLTIVGAPLGIPLLLVLGKWIAKPLQQHPNFRIPTQAEQLRARQIREGTYIEDQYMNTAEQYRTPDDWYNER